MIFDYQPDTAFGATFKVWEVAPGASASGPARNIIEGLEESFPVIVMTYGPDGKMPPTRTDPDA